MFWRRGYTLRGEVGGGWALEFPSFLGPVKWHRADRRVPFGPKKVPGGRGEGLTQKERRGILRSETKQDTDSQVSTIPNHPFGVR